MKKLGILLFCLFTIQIVQAQSITIIDQNSLQPIENVEVYKSNENVLVAKSDQFGVITLSGIPSNQTLIFINPMYSSITISIEQLKSQDNILSMIENINSINEIVVSASKFEEQRKDVAQKIQVIRSSELQNMNQTSTADVMSNTGNVFVQKSQLGGGSPIIRGFETNKVLMVVDGIRMNTAIYRGGHLQNIITLDNAMMDRMEVVYGPGSVVYGSDALGGVMSFKTKNPLLSSNGKVKVKANAFTRYMSANDGYAAHCNISVGGKKFGSLTSFTYSSFGDLRQGANREIYVGNFGARPWYVERIDGKDSVIINADTNVQVGSGYNQIDMMQKFLFQQSAEIRHIINVQYSTSSNIPRYDRLTLVSNGLPKFAEWNYGPQNRLLASYTLELSKSTVIYDNARFILGYQQIEESRIDRKLNDIYQNNRIENLDVITANLDMAKKMDKHEFRYGIEGWYNKVNSTAFTKDINTGIHTPLDTRYASGGATMSSGAVYATHTWEISERIIVNDGLRFSNVGLNAQFTDTTFFNFPFKEAIQNNSALTGNLGIVYMPLIDCRITALISTGFRAPNVDDLSKVFESTPGNITVPNADLKPEFTYNGELGISNKFGDWLTLQGTGYYTMYRNALNTQNFKFNGQDSIMYAGLMSKVVATTNSSNAFLYGLELNMNARLNDNIVAYATYNYTYARIVTDSTLIPLDHIPPKFGKFGFQINEKKFRADLFVNFSAKKKIEEYSPSGEDNEAYALPQGMPSWYTVNIRLNYQFNKFAGLQLACENILDQNYRQFASNISAPGRNFILTLRGNF